MKTATTEMAKSKGSAGFAAWLARQPRTEKLRIAAAIGHYPQHVHRIAAGIGTPSVVTAFRIEDVTKGEVKAKDFTEILEGDGGSEGGGNDDGK